VRLIYCSRGFRSASVLFRDSDGVRRGGRRYEGKVKSDVQGKPAATAARSRPAAAGRDRPLQGPRQKQNQRQRQRHPAKAGRYKFTTNVKSDREGNEPAGRLPTGREAGATNTGSPKLS